MSHRLRVSLAIIGIGMLVLAGVMLLNPKGANSSPANNPAYEAVIQLIQEGSIMRSESGIAALPDEYAYLSLDGTISIHVSPDGSHTQLIFFKTAFERDAGRVQGYLYKANDIPPLIGDFAPLPYADSYRCSRVKPRWFSCTYYFH